MKARHWDQLAADGVLALGRYGWGKASDLEETLGKREKAVENLGRRLPEEFYAKFKAGMQGRVWFTPLFGIGGSTKDVPAQRIIYVSPVWEAASEELVEYIVLHEMIHVAQGHTLNLNSHDPKDRLIDERQEAEVDRIVVELGFVDRRADALQFLADLKQRLGIPPRH